MSMFLSLTSSCLSSCRRAGLIGLSLLSLMPFEAGALPAFARQTGQQCVACHAGGQFPELTPYGRQFKLTGYTIGVRTLPLAVMGVVNYARVADTARSDDPGTDFSKNATPLLATGSLFIAGKLADNIGAFSQITYDHYATRDNDGRYHGHSSVDNIDLRYADHLIGPGRDLIFGFSLNNNPSVTDPWNTAPAWMQYVPAASPTSHQFADANTPFPGTGSGDHLSGLNAYLFWDKTVYAELGAYRTASGALSFMTAGIPDADRTRLKGENNPYWRLALSREWGPHNLMLGTSGMIARRYDDPSNPSDPNGVSHFRNIGLDAQYQFLLEPHTATFQMAYMRQKQDYSADILAAGAPSFFDANGNPLAPPNPSDTTRIFRAKLSYIYEARYGGSLAFFNLTGSTNTLNQTSGYDSSGLITTSDPNNTGITSTRVNGNLSGNPGTRGFTFEAFWLPMQYVRVGAQYTAYAKYNGASENYDGFGRNARDNNTLFLYLWGAY